MIKVIIADDEHHAIDRLKDLLTEYHQFEIIAEVNNGSKALEKIVELKPDVAFLDINMPGIPVFNTIRSLQNPPLVVFQTAHSKYATDAFDVDAVDYLLKPISRERFGKTITKIIHRAEAIRSGSTQDEPSEKELSDKISIKVSGKIQIINIKDIQKICFEEGLSFIYTHENRWLSDKTLNYYESKFEHQNFFRTNRANLVNLDYVSTIHKAFKGEYIIELRDGSRVDLSRRKAQLLKKHLDF